MAYDCKVVLDSVAPNGKRLTTLALTYPRIVHSEFLTHRDRARNSASSRAIPWPKMLNNIVTDPFVPAFGKEQSGMQTGEELSDVLGAIATGIWLRARNDAVTYAKALAELGVHKSICNRLTEPWMWITVVTTATEWANFFRLRCHPDAEVHIRRIAEMARDAMDGSGPRALAVNDWHLPYVSESPDEEELADWASSRTVGPLETTHTRATSTDLLCRVSVARCARVSYLTHEGLRDPEKDLELFERLVRGSGFGHWSPHEHVARAERELVRSGPFVGWTQYRKTFEGECAT